MVRNVSFKCRFLVFVVVAAASLLVAFGPSGHAVAAGTRSAAAAPPRPLSQKAWNALVARAKQEGSVALYSSFLPDQLNALATAFTKKYGIDVTLVRAVESVGVVQVTAEHGTRNVKVDLWQVSNKPYVLGAEKNGWVTAAVGPNFFKKRFDRAKYAKPGKAFMPGGAVLGFGWNTTLYPHGLSKYTDILDPSLNGRIGVLEPTSPAGFDYYLWLAATYGKQFQTRLAAMKPKLYIGTLLNMSALTSGEITASAFVSGSLLDMKDQGAPVDFKPINWAPPLFTMIMKQAPHPAAAQLLADFMVTPEGQAALFHRAVAALPNIPDTFNIPLRNMKLSQLTPKKIEAQRAEWEQQFHS
jgi:iron(III) transport system substrate-binding protein